MRVSRRSSVARRAAICLIATFALLLQSLLAAPATAFGIADPAICVQPNGTQPEDPAGEHGSNHGLCCILACVACGVAFVASSAGTVAFPERPGSRIVFASTATIPVSAPLKFYFAARGPPTDI
jgi:hypothetical protein